MEAANPYQPPSIPADPGPVIQPTKSSPLSGILAVAVGAIFGGCAGIFVVAWFASHFVSSSTRSFVMNDQQVLLQLFVSLPVGCVVGGLFAKWCLLQFASNR